MINNFVFFNGFPIISRGAIYTFIISNRNFGKTWLFKKRAFRRALKHGKKTIWIRRFKKEAKEAADKLFSSSDLQKFCGIQWYDSDKKTGNCRRKGNTFYVKRNGKWEWFLSVYALSDSSNIRGVDDIKFDTIVFDEFQTTPNKYNRYRGDEVTDLNDILFSVKRNHKVRVFFLGNKESAHSPYFSYFNIPEIPENWEGIRTYRNGSVAVQVINNKQNAVNDDYNDKLNSLFSGTKYGRYIYNSETKTKESIKINKRPPKESELYLQLCINNQYLRILSHKGFFFVVNGCELSKPIYCNNFSQKERHFLLTRRLKKFFASFENGITNNSVYYQSHGIYEAITPFYKWLGVFT